MADRISKSKLREHADDLQKVAKILKIAENSDSNIRDALKIVLKVSNKLLEYCED